MAINEDTKLEELQRIKRELRELLPLLSKWRVEELQKIISHHYTHKWKHKSFRKYGAINKGFTQEELVKFLSVIEDDRFLLMFSYQAFCGLRIGEVTKVNIADFDFTAHTLKVHTEKAQTLDIQKVPEFLFSQTLDYLQRHTKEIDDSKGFLFFADKRYSHTEMPHIDLHYARNMFRHYISLTGLNEIYDTTEESVVGRTKRRLYRLSSHSLRHYAITSFNRAVNGNITLTKAFARHRDLSSTQVYIHTSKEELYNAIV
jgi:integrase